MANISYEALIRCPFFLKLDERSVACEGHAPGTCMITRFSNAAAKKSHLRENCYRETGGDCFLAAALYRKYEE